MLDRWKRPEAVVTILADGGSQREQSHYEQVARCLLHAVIDSGNNPEADLLSSGKTRKPTLQTQHRVDSLAGPTLTFRVAESFNHRKNLVHSATLVRFGSWYVLRTLFCSRCSLLMMLLVGFLFFCAPRTAFSAGCVVHERPVFGLTVGTMASLIEPPISAAQDAKSTTFQISPKPCAGEPLGVPGSSQLSLSAYFEPTTLQEECQVETALELSPLTLVVRLASTLDRPPRYRLDSRVRAC